MSDEHTAEMKAEAEVRAYFERVQRENEEALAQYMRNRLADVIDAYRVSQAARDREVRQMEQNDMERMRRGR